MILRIILYVLAAVSIWYSFMIYSVHSGSSFFMVWAVIGVFLVLTGIALKTGLFKKIPVWLNISLAAVVVAALIVIVVLLFIIVSYSEEKPEKDLDYLIVLGSQVKPDGPSRVLKYRLDRAEKYLKENPSTICIVSGGRGTNELQSEASAMKQYLVEAGIDPERIIMEDRSTTTDENIMYSKSFLPENASIGLVTNDFHMFRGVYLCKKHGLYNVYPIPADSDPFYKPNNYLREVLAFIKDSLL